ncbi:hypothetical protein BCR44DRAFT_1138933 [Catenaria anguillulae PL171]|uniref:Uncharacterized protein n=1 Tax=Catenaria anguillulae PL171 TaxID=765915 RepID=A0A1Y2HK30_9FUNG|nr:hypothetical protein BCR44DRAFT_1138933 [Catenaria anguillulae PL171]
MRTHFSSKNAIVALPPAWILTGVFTYRCTRYASLTAALVLASPWVHDCVPGSVAKLVAALLWVDRRHAQGVGHVDIVADGNHHIQAHARDAQVFVRVGCCNTARFKCRHYQDFGWGWVCIDLRCRWSCQMAPLSQFCATWVFLFNVSLVRGIAVQVLVAIYMHM